MNIKEFIDNDPYHFKLNEKAKFFEIKINELTNYHYKKSVEYRKILKFFDFQLTKRKKINEIPFLPANLFKEHTLKSIPNSKIFKTLNSSGTSGALPSKIILDKENSSNQIKVLSKIISRFIGKERIPMLIIDNNLKVIDRSNFNARSAAIIGFSIFGKDHTYLLNEKNKINYNILNNFLKKYETQNFFIFGFTSKIFENLIEKLSYKKIKKNFAKGILLHGGGWKKLENKKIDNKKFKKKLYEKLKLKKIYNYYGLVEQTGSIFIECEKCGCFFTSIFSDIIIRDNNFKDLGENKKGLIQVLSLLPTSYPGHSILTDDYGEIISKNECECSKFGKRFRVYGRIKKSEIRGCSDT